MRHDCDANLYHDVHTDADEYAYALEHSDRDANPDRYADKDMSL